MARRDVRRRQTEKWRAEGRCIACGRPAATGKASCGLCIRRTVEQTRVRRRQRAADGLCRGCGAAPETGRRMCKACSARTVVSHRRHGSKCDPDLYADYFTAQGGLCAICGDPPGRRALAADHNTETNLVRGLLCSRCNPGIGFFKHDVARLRAAIVYLTGAP